MQLANSARIADQPLEHGWGPAIAAGLFVLLAGLLPALSIGVPSGPKHLTWLVLLHASIIVLSATRIGLIVASGTPRILTLVFWMYVYFWLGLAAFAQLSLETFPLPARFSEAELGTASILVLVGVIGFELGHLLRPPRAANRSMLLLGTRGISWRSVALLTLASLLLSPFLVVEFGGLSAFLTSRQAVVQAGALLQPDSDSRTLLGIYNALLVIPPLVAILGWFQLRRAGQLRNRGLLPIVVLAVLLAINAIVNNPISQPRAWFSVFVFSLVTTTPWARGKRGLPVAASGMILLLATLLPFASYFRYNQPSAPDSVEAVATQYSGSGDYDSYEQIAAGVHYVESFGYDYGAHFLGPALFWVPRSIWQQKPRDTGVVLGEFERYTNTNLSAPLWIEAYIAFGMPLTFIVFIVIGALWRRLDDAFVLTDARSSALTNLVVPLLAAYQMSVLRGSLLAMTGRLVAIILLPVLISVGLKISSRRSPSSATVAFQSRQS